MGLEMQPRGGWFSGFSRLHPGEPPGQGAARPQGAVVPHSVPHGIPSPGRCRAGSCTEMTPSLPTNPPQGAAKGILHFSPPPQVSCCTEGPAPCGARSCTQHPCVPSQVLLTPALTEPPKPPKYMQYKTMQKISQHHLGAPGKGPAPP